LLHKRFIRLDQAWVHNMVFKVLTFATFVTLFSFSVTYADKDKITLNCHSTSDSYYSGPSFQLTFLNNLQSIKELEACFAKCRKGEKPPLRWEVQDVSENGMKLMFSPSTKTPKDSQYYAFNFGTLELSSIIYQVPWPGTDEAFKTMGFKGKPNREWKRLGVAKYQCRKKRTKIVE
jgi:hypothetical protein